MIIDSNKSTSKADNYHSLAKQLVSLLGGEQDWICNMSQFTGFVYQMLADINWAGFYLVNDGRLILGPYQGNVACSPIEFGKGVCGKVAQTGVRELVGNVEEFTGHIACDSTSKSELVVPIIIAGQIRAVFDLDSPILARFDNEDAKGVEQLIKTLLNNTDWSKKV